MNNRKLIMKFKRNLVHLILIAFLAYGNSSILGYAADTTAIKVQLQSNLKAGQSAFFNQDYPEAERCFKIAGEDAAALGNKQIYAYAYSYLGFSQVYLDKLDEAELNLIRSEPLAFSPGIAPTTKMLTLLAYIELYTRRGDIATAQKYIQQTLNQDDASFLAINITREPLKQSYRNNQILQKNIDELSTPSKAGNYIKDALLNGKVLRWNDETKVITIYISPGSHIKGWNPEYADNFKKACLIWQGVLNNKIQFQFVENKSDAVDTIVTWYADQSAKPAVTESTYLKDTMVKADIAFHLIDNSNQFYVPRTIYKLSLHELGHLLGISGHSRNPGDIMFPATTYAIKPSSRDISTLLELYSRPAQITNPSGKTLSEYQGEVISQGKHPIVILNH